ncbi:membrane protein ORF114 [Cyprinid herpesvirus 1]|uniref:Membrane protein ORF114 n=1 Tax=Cyprinid herpesvirus 1 TaxID=317858 RepID=K7PBM4_9VIRU|nr:membrane protein ORF114 [Cyprinid herpesvirus 1]AFJ20416.1 membrane protein ORF114 [Cyprinid herpesvirus 1]
MYTHGLVCSQNRVMMMMLLQRGKKLAITILVGFCLATTIIDVCFNGLAAVGQTPFHNSSLEIATRIYPTKLTPIRWTPGICGFIYVCLIVINLHLFACRFWRPAVYHLDDSGKNWPALSFFAIWPFVCLLDVIRLIVWDYHTLEGTAIGTTLIMVLLSGLLWLELVLISRESHYNLDHFRIFVKNGVALYAGWCSYETAAHLTAAIQYEGKKAQAFDPEIAAILGLVFLTISFVVFSALDFVYFKYTKQIFAVHVGILWGVLGILCSQTYTYPVIYSVFLGLGVLITLCVKAGLGISRSVITQ